MLDVLLLRFDAPLVSFGGVVVDRHGVSFEFPARSLLTGLLANALGLDHRQAELLERLQRRLRHAARCDLPGEAIVDYQTVDLGQSFMLEGWTTRGAPESREGGTASKGTHFRYRHYLADAVYTLALTLEPAAESPTLDDCARALEEPERPLFLGRKCCLPAAPLLLGRRQAASLRAALESEPRSRRDLSKEPLRAWWPAEEEPPDPGQARQLPVCDERDWHNQVHVGRRFQWEGRLEVPEVAHDG